MAEKKAKKKDSKLSIAAAVTALFIFTIPIGFILAIADLIKSKGDKSQRHLGSYFAIVSFVLFLIVAFSNGSGNSSNNATQITTTVPQKTKTRYTVNLNPLRPFTLVNKKEKIKQQGGTYSQHRFVCNKCGLIFW